MSIPTPRTDAIRRLPSTQQVVASLALNEELERELAEARAGMRDSCHDAAEEQYGCFRAVRAEREADDYKQKYLLLSAQHVREVETLGRELDSYANREAAAVKEAMRLGRERFAERSRVLQLEHDAARNLHLSATERARGDQLEKELAEAEGRGTGSPRQIARHAAVGRPRSDRACLCGMQTDFKRYGY